MIEFRPQALYSREDLEAMLAEVGISVEQFLDRVRPAKLFKSCYYGADLIAAMESAQRIQERPQKRQSVPTPALPWRTKKRSSTARAESAVSDALSRMTGSSTF